MNARDGPDAPEWRMCVVAFAWQLHPRWRLVLAGNRDEFHARPTAALAAGAHGISNGRLDAPWPKTRRLAAALQTWVEAGNDELSARRWAALADERRFAPGGVFEGETVLRNHGE